MGWSKILSLSQLEKLIDWMNRVNIISRELEAPHPRGVVEVSEGNKLG